jgi:quercetin dioxygenase-like cupin family protein
MLRMGQKMYFRMLSYNEIHHIFFERTENMRIFLALMFTAVLFGQSALADGKITVETLAADTRSWDGSVFQYPEGSAEITVVKLSLPSGTQLPLHCHPAPLAAYVLEGELEVTNASGQTKSFKKGNAFIEVMNRWHKGLVKGKDTQLIVFYAGKKNQPLSVTKDGDSSLVGRCD